jgi:hypothetical protein
VVFTRNRCIRPAKQFNQDFTLNDLSFEHHDTAVALATALIAMLAGGSLMMPPSVAYTAAAVLALLGLIRGRQALRVLRYQRNMHRPPTYRLRADRIPLSQRKLFLGHGFRRNQKHTQRLRDTIRPEVQRYV